MKTLIKCLAVCLIHSCLQYWRESTSYLTFERHPVLTAEAEAQLSAHCRSCGLVELRVISYKIGKGSYPLPPDSGPWIRRAACWSPIPAQDLPVARVQLGSSKIWWLSLCSLGVGLSQLPSDWLGLDSLGGDWEPSMERQPSQNLCSLP